MMRHTRLVEPIRPVIPVTLQAEHEVVPVGEAHLQQLREVMRQRIDLLEPHACNHSRMI